MQSDGDNNYHFTPATAEWTLPEQQDPLEVAGAAGNPPRATTPPPGEDQVVPQWSGDEEEGATALPPLPRFCSGSVTCPTETVTDSTSGVTEDTMPLSLTASAPTIATSSYQRPRSRTGLRLPRSNRRMTMEWKVGGMPLADYIHAVEDDSTLLRPEDLCPKGEKPTVVLQSDLVTQFPMITRSLRSSLRRTLEESAPTPNAIDNVLSSTIEEEWEDPQAESYFLSSPPLLKPSDMVSSTEETPTPILLNNPIPEAQVLGVGRSASAPQQGPAGHAVDRAEDALVSYSIDPPLQEQYVNSSPAYCLLGLCVPPEPALMPVYRPLPSATFKEGHTEDDDKYFSAISPHVTPSEFALMLRKEDDSFRKDLNVFFRDKGDEWIALVYAMNQIEDYHRDVLYDFCKARAKVAVSPFPFDVNYGKNPRIFTISFGYDAFVVTYVKGENGLQLRDRMFYQLALRKHVHFYHYFYALFLKRAVNEFIMALNVFVKPQRKLSLLAGLRNLRL